MFKQPLTKAIARAAGPIGAISAVGSFLSDVLKPLANFAPILAALTVLITIILAFVLIRLDRKLDDKDVWDTFPGAIYMVFAASAIVFSGWSVVITYGPERGYVADNVDAVAALQDQLGLIQQDVAEIKETTEQIATQQAEGFASLEEALANIQSGQMTIIESPATPQEWYNNAKIYQLRGDTTNAIAAYEGYFASDGALTFVDPFEDYVDLINATQGIARARDIIGDLQSQNPDNPTLQLMAAVLLNTVDERVTALETLTAQNPAYGPGFLYLGRELDRKLRETTTNDLLQRQSAAYTRLFELELNQGFSNFYIDKLKAQEKLADALVQLEAYQQAANTLGNVDLLVSYSVEGVIFIVVFPEVTGQDAFYGIDDPAAPNNMGKTTLGSISYINSSLGPLQVPIGEHTFYFRYLDQNGAESEIFSFPFTVEPIFVIWSPNPPDFSTGIISGSLIFEIPYQEDSSLTYTYQYSIDDDSLSQELVGIYVGVVELPNVAKGEHTVYVQAVGPDGTVTDVVAFTFVVE